jgi:hypothetical protein
LDKIRGTFILGKVGAFYHFPPELIYPDGSRLEVSTTPSPYFQTWFCNGGKGSGEFTDSNGKSLLRRNWDGMGIEIGSSPLDHNGNIDETVDYDRN